jgi:sec-independent protein translocase protein TatB
MFGLDFLELVVIFIVALVVLGPTRLPEVARKVGRWVGKARAMARDFRQQLESEVTLAELNRMTEEQSRRTQAATPPPAADTTGPSTNGSRMEDPAAVPAEPAVPQPGDDTYSHAHANGAPPQPWSPEDDIPTGSSVRSADPAVTDDVRHGPQRVETGDGKSHP